MENKKSKFTKQEDFILFTLFCETYLCVHWLATSDCLKPCWDSRIQSCNYTQLVSWFNCWKSKSYRICSPCFQQVLDSLKEFSHVLPGWIGEHSNPVSLRHCIWGGLSCFQRQRGFLSSMHKVLFPSICSCHCLSWDLSTNLPMVLC